MRRVNWNGEPLDGAPLPVPVDLADTLFNYLPPAIPLTPAMHELADKYANGFLTGQDYAALQAAAFLRPRAEDIHRQRKDTYRLRAAEAAAVGFQVPENFRQLVLNDAYMDRLHHNNIWMRMPDELGRIPRDPSRLIFPAFVEGQGICDWSLLLQSDGSHCMIFCEQPLGAAGEVRDNSPDSSPWVIEECAGSVEEWLFHYFRESYEHDCQYLMRLEAYQSDGSDG